MQDLATFYGALLGGDLLPRRLLDEATDPADRLPRGTGRPRNLPVQAAVRGLCLGPRGSTLGYSLMALASQDGSHVVAVGANAFASGEFYELVEKTARDLYCRT